MSIQFHCPSCDQPVEVDDEWAQRMVACPYCRKTIAAPAHSTLDPDAAVPVATPLGADQQPPAATVAPFKPNRLAAVGFALTGLVFVLLFVIMLIGQRHPDEIRRIHEISQRGLTYAEMQKTMMEEFAEDEVFPPPWMVAMTLLMVTALLAWFVALICCVIAFRSAHRRRLTVFSLVALAFIPLFLLTGT